MFMVRYIPRSVSVAMVLLGVCGAPLAAQHDHAMMQGPLPVQPGQAAYGVLAEVVRILEADSATDWTTVNLEALRQHLIDMDAVTMRATMTARNVDGGVEARFTGAGATVGAIKRMVLAHARALDALPDFRVTASETSSGATLTVTAERADDARLVTKIRGLGPAGLLVLDDHHARHHLMLARGDAPHGQ